MRSYKVLNPCDVSDISVIKYRTQMVTVHMCHIESDIRIKQNIYFVDPDWFRQVVGCQWLLESWY